MRARKIVFSILILMVSPFLWAFEADDADDSAQTAYAFFHFPVIDELRLHLRTGRYADWATDLEWEALNQIYAKRDYIPIWLGPEGVSERATHLRNAIVKAYDEGLNPAEYHAPALQYMWRARRPVTRARLELLLTDAFLRYSREVSMGYYHPKSVDFDWKLPRKKFDALALFESYLTTDLPDMFLTHLPPAHEAYQKLKLALVQYREIAKSGGWLNVKHGRALRIGDKNKRVLQLRRRLQAEGFYETSKLGKSNPKVFDATLETAVKKFQALNGHKVDGIAGWFTLRSLNVSVEQRIAEIKKNMERWRWLPNDLGNSYVMVNMAGYELSLVNDNINVLNMPVVIGKTVRATPSFVDTMEYLEFNPTWKVPPRIAKEKILPKLQENPDFIKSRNMLVYESWEKKADVVDPDSINWNHYSPERWFPFKFVQQPGDHNSLGRVKFMFPNKYRIYLHDTPYKEQFNKYVRTFSAGCIRVAKPYVLAEKILREEGNWDSKKIKDIVSEGETQQVKLNSKWPVYLLYWTAWVDENGQVNFRNDVYRRNTNIAAGAEPDYQKMVLAQNMQ